MSTSIEWVRGDDGSEGESWNALRAIREHKGKTVSANHCEHVNEACRFCYAERLNARLGGLPFKPGHRKDYRFVVDEKKLTEPLRWKRPRRIFVESMSDAFGDWWPDDYIDQLYAVMALTPHHTYINLSKRPARRRKYLSAARAHPVGMAAFEFVLNDHAAKQNSMLGDGIILQGDMPHLKVWPLPNVIEGTSVSNQPEADEFIPILLETPAAMRAVSAEPLLGPIDFRHNWQPEGICIDWLSGKNGTDPEIPKLDWIIVGGESGDNARPMSIQWVREIRDQCKAAGVAFFFKQWGEWAPAGAGRDGDPGRFAFGDYEHDRTLFLQVDGYPRHFTMFGAHCLLKRVGKKAAGRLLDGRTWDEFPGS